MTDFFLMRHAPTEWNAAGRIQGQADSPLTPTGVAWAVRWGTTLAGRGLNRLVTSDAGRAAATARHMNAALDLPTIIEARLREQDWGRWTGRVHDRLRTRAAEDYARRQAQGWDFRPPGGESPLEVLERALAALRDFSAAYAGERVLVVTHEGVLKSLVYHLAVRDGCGADPSQLRSYHLHHVKGTGNHLVLVQMNAVNLNPENGRSER